MSDDTTRGGEARLVDRRRFLTRLGGLGAAGAAWLAMGDRASALAAGIAPRAAARPIYMLSLGDSIMWGQGLAEPQKFRNIVQQWIRANNPEGRDVVQANYAHSGASLGYFPFGPNGRSSRFLARTRARVGARVDPTGTREIDTDLDDAFARDSAGWRRDREIAAAAAADRRPAPEAPTAEEKYGGEIPRTNPVLWRQLDMATADLQARGIRPEDVDFVLMDGGANDVDFVLSVTNPDFTANWVEFAVREAVKQRMEGFLPWALKTFPNAKFVVTGYYPGVTGKTDPTALLGMVAQVRPLYAALGLALPVVTAAVGVPYFNATIARGAAFEKATSDGLRAAVAQSHGRAVFVSPEFQPEHAYAAPQTLMFRFEERDPAAPGREAECRTIYGTKATTRAPDALSPEGFCRKAATFHPNPAGARRYADRVIAALPGFLPMVAGKGGAAPGGQGGQP